MPEHHGYDVLIADDDEMPPGVPWLYVCTGNRLICVLRRSAINGRMLTEAWAAYRELAVPGGAVPMVA